MPPQTTRDSPPCADLPDKVLRRLDELTGVELVGRVHDVYEVVREPVTEIPAWLCGADVQMAIHLHGVGVDDLETLIEEGGKDFGLSHGCRSEEDDERKDSVSLPGGDTGPFA